MTIKTRYTQQTLRESYTASLKKTAWIRRLLKNAEVLDSLSDIVALDSLWDEVFPWFNGPGRRTLYLHYCGKAKDADSFKEDSIRIMRALKCVFGDPEVSGGYYSSSPPSTHYRCSGRVGKIRVRVDLVVPWLPKGCEVKTERHRSQQTNVTYSVSCRR